MFCGCLLTSPLRCFGPGPGPGPGRGPGRAGPGGPERSQESPCDLLSTRSTFNEGNAGSSATLLEVSAAIYFQRDLLSTNLLLTRSTFNEGSRASRRDLLSTRSTSNESTFIELSVLRFTSECTELASTFHFAAMSHKLQLFGVYTVCMF